MSEDFIIEDDFEEPEYPSPAEVGDTVTVTGTLTTVNSSGGTESLKHDGVECVVTKAFWDYEAGWRFHGRVVDEAKLEDFRAQATSEYTPDYWKEKYPDQPHHYERSKAALESFDPGYVYFSEHSLAPSLAPRR